MNSVRILLAKAIDYAGLFPPAGLSMNDAVRNYMGYRAGGDSWALGRFVVPVARVEESGLPTEQLSVVDGLSEIAGPVVFLERPVELLGEPRRSGACPKVRCGGVTPDKFPSPDALSSFVVECARLKLRFKATAGLHHAIRSTYKLTYEPSSGCAAMHGFLNLLLGASLAWHGGSHAQVRAMLEEENPAVFQFDDEGVSWDAQRLSNAQLTTAREEFILSFGSCSFEEPLQELEKMGLL